MITFPFCSPCVCFNIYFLREILDSRKIEKKVQRFSIYSLPALSPPTHTHTHTHTHTQSLPHCQCSPQDSTFVTVDEPRLTHSYSVHSLH